MGAGVEDLHLGFYESHYLTREEKKRESLLAIDFPLPTALKDKKTKEKNFLN